jgi:hypothetical protein
VSVRQVQALAQITDDAEQSFQGQTF